jgi:hypothetical protein
MGTGSFSRVKRPGCGADHPPTSSERVKLYLYPLPSLGLQACYGVHLSWWQYLILSAVNSLTQFNVFKRIQQKWPTHFFAWKRITHFLSCLQDISWIYTMYLLQLRRLVKSDLIFLRERKLIHAFSVGNYPLLFWISSSAVTKWVPRVGRR